MRTSLILFVLAWASAAASPVSALEASDTMAIWKSATSVEKSKLVADMLKTVGATSGSGRVIKCLNAAAGAPGHSDLSISEVFEACKREAGQAV